MAKTKTRIPKVVMDAVREYAKARDLPGMQFVILRDLALKSYKNTPLAARDTWTLKAIVEQGL